MKPKKPKKQQAMMENQQTKPFAWDNLCSIELPDHETKGMTNRQLARHLRENAAWSCSQIGLLLGVTEDSVYSALYRRKQTPSLEASSPEDLKLDLMREGQRVLSITAKRQEAYYHYFFDMLSEATKDISPISTIPPPIDIPTDPLTDFEPETVALQISDLHVGEHIESSFSYGLSEYSLNIFANRVISYVQRVVRLLSIYKRSIPIDDLVIFVQGDLIHNETMRGSAKMLADTTLPWQMMLAVRGLIYIILSMLNYFTTVKVVCIPGNHGRIGKKGEEHPLNNMDYLAYMFLKEMLSLLVQDENRLSVEAPPAVFSITEIQGKNFLSIHGDTAISWLGIPYYGVDRIWSRLQAIAQRLKKPFDYLLVAHHHVIAEWDKTDGSVIMNGCWSGGSSFAVSQLHYTVPARQNFFLVHPKQGVHSISKINLEIADKSKYKKDAIDQFMQPETTKWLASILDFEPGATALAQK